MIDYKRALISISIFGAVTIVSLMCVLFSYLNTSNLYSTQLENIYKKNLYELVSSVNSVEVDISKIVATTSFETQQKLLNSIYLSCNDIENNLEELPISHAKTQKVTNLYNVLSGYIYSLIRDNSKLTEENLTSLEDLHTSCLIVMYDLNNYLNDISHSYSIMEDVDYKKEVSSGFNGGLTESNVNDSSVPTLIYDGPFSDSVINKEILGLGDIVITKDQAESVIMEKLKGYDIKNIKFDGETVGKFATFNYNVYAKNINLYVQVSKRGGKIISINSSANNGIYEYDENLCKELAQNFAANLGYEDMYPVWSQVNGNVVYVNLAPLVDGVIYYPDLVKVKIDSTRAQVIGLDATNYCYNHRKRIVKNPEISTATAQQSVGSKLEIVDTNLAVIPNEFVGETFVYEFVCVWKDYKYYIYVDAITGEEVDILRVCDTSYGSLVA